MPELPEAQPPQDFANQALEPSRHGYWGPLPWESPELYKALGAPMMEKIILRSPGFWRGEFNMSAGRDLEVGKPGSIPPPASRQERLERLVSFTKGNEAWHTAAFATLGTIGLCYAFEGGWRGAVAATATTAINLFGNIPPIIVQRYNRLRAYRLLDKIQRREPEAPSE